MSEARSHGAGDAGRDSYCARGGRFDNLEEGDSLDVLIVGGGITGAPIYQTLCRRGYRVALIDKGDFSSGTSQASGMLIWGGLLYLRNLEFSTVVKLCRARKNLMNHHARDTTSLDLRYLTRGQSRTRAGMVWLALQLYWLLGGCELRRPRFRSSAEGNAHVYQEGMLRGSDSRFVIERISEQQSEHCIALNHCRLTGAAYDASAGLWRIELKDAITGAEVRVRSKALVNAAGVWADGVNRIAGLDSPCKHVFSKGVYLMFPRGGEIAAEVHPMRGQDDVLTHVPWGPVMMWGPTETAIRDPEEGLAPTREDVRFLLEHAGRCLPGKPGAEDVVSVRCGVRPLAVPRSFDREVYPLDLSRGHQVVVHKEKRAISLYGGKFTSSMEVAGHAAGLLKSWITPNFPAPMIRGNQAEVRMLDGFGYDCVTPVWARDHEFCMTLEDYLRRRTNIAQWTPRMGLGRDGDKRGSLLEIARVFASGRRDADDMVSAYEARVRELHDPLLSA